MRIANLNFPMEKLNNFTLYDYILNMDEMTYHPMRKEYALEDGTREDKDDKMFGR
jgi:hypothetical protein